MRSRLIIVLTVLAMLFAMLTIVGCASEEPDVADEPTEEPSGDTDEPAAGAPDAQTVLETSCVFCHDANRIYLASDATDWEATIERMNAEHSKTHPGDAPLLAVEQEQAIIDFMKTRTQSAGEVVVREKCVTCHELDNITRQAQGADWEAIIDRMIGDHDASLTEQEQQDALNFLQGQ
ncbi:MAG: hypothetical protein ACYC2X_01880 [Coriobacteriia bacterium]